MKMKLWKQKVTQLWAEEDGIGTLEVILIVAVIVIIAVAFRKWIIAWVNDLFKKSNDNLKEINNNSTITELGPNAN